MQHMRDHGMCLQQLLSRNGPPPRATSGVCFDHLLFQTRSTGDVGRLFYHRQLCDCKAHAEVSGVTAKRPSKLPLETFSTLEDGILCSFMDESASAANADHLWTLINSTGKAHNTKRRRVRERPAKLPGRNCCRKRRRVRLFNGLREHDRQWMYG